MELILVVVISAGSAENSQNGVSRSLIRINVRISYRLHFTSSTCHFINAPLHQRVASSTYRVIDVPRHQRAASLTFKCFVRQQPRVAEVDETHHFADRAVVPLQRLQVLRQLRTRLVHHVQSVVAAPVVAVAVEEFILQVVGSSQRALLNVDQVPEELAQIVRYSYRLDVGFMRRVERRRAVRLEPNLRKQTHATRRGQPRSGIARQFFGDIIFFGKCNYSLYDVYSYCVLRFLLGDSYLCERGSPPPDHDTIV